MTDIVERLRCVVLPLITHAELREAADEIERLRGELHSVHAHMNHLREMIDIMRDALKKITATVPGDWSEADDIARLALQGKRHD